MQSIVNLSSEIMENLKVPIAEFSSIEAKFEESATFEEVLAIIEHMSTVSLKTLKKFISRSDLKQKEAEKNRLKEDLSLSIFASNNYEDLEKLLQKYEAEIREHIKIEQQMKIYSDNLEEKISELETEENLKVKSIERENLKLKTELENFRQEKQLVKNGLQRNYGVNLALSVPKHRKTQSIDSVY